jgi:nitroreductase
VEALDAIHTRRSVSRLPADAVTRSEIEAVLGAALCAPNHHLTHPWRFVVLQGEARRALGHVHAQAVMDARPELPAESFEKEVARLERAPVVIACIVTPTGTDAVTAREDRDAVAAAVQNLLLAAHASGLAAIWRTGAMADSPAVRSDLGCGPDDAVVGFVYLGRSDGTSKEPTPRPPLDEVVEWRGVGATS